MPWINIRKVVPVEALPKHLLWAILFMKVYDTEVDHETFTGVHRETFQLRA